MLHTEILIIIDVDMHIHTMCINTYTHTLTDVVYTWVSMLVLMDTCVYELVKVSL